MRKPSEYVAAAVRNLQSRLLPDRKALLTCGDVSATVVRTSATTFGDDEISGDAPAEHFSVLAVAKDLPRVAKNDFASLSCDGTTTHHIITKASVDASGAALKLGLSNPLESHDASVSGRRDALPFTLSLSVLVDLSGLASDFASDLSSTDVRSYRIAIASADWALPSPPRMGDVIRFIDRDAQITARIATVETKTGLFLISARSSVS